MKKIFTGLIFVFLSFSLTIGDSVIIDFIPDFIGYILIFQGLNQLSGESYKFVKMKPYAMGMVLYTGILYAMDLLGISANLNVEVNLVLGAISTVLELFILYNIVMGIHDIELNRNYFLNASQLKTYWKVMTVFSVITYIMLFLPSLLIISALIEFVAAVCFLTAFNKSKNLYIDLSVL